MTNQTRNGGVPESVPAALDRSAAAVAVPPTLAARMAHLPFNLAHSEPERQAIRLLRNVFAAEEGRLELRVVPEFDGTAPATIETHGVEVAEVLTRWSHACQRGEVEGLLLHLAVLIRRAAAGMSRQVAEDARAAVDAYATAARSHIQAGPQPHSPITRGLAFLIPAVEMLNSAMHLTLIAPDKNRGQDIADLVLSTARTYITVEYVEEIGYVLSMMKALLIFPKVASKAEVLKVLREGERICAGRSTHRIVVEALWDHPGLSPAERRQSVEQWALVMIRTAATLSPNEAYAMHLEVNEFCHAHGISGGSIISQNSAALVEVAPQLELQRHRMEIPQEVQAILARATAVATQRIGLADALDQAFAEIAMDPPPLPVKRELDDAGVEGIVLLPMLKITDRGYPLRSVPLEHLLPEKAEDRRMLTMVLCAQVPAAALDAVGEHFHPTVEEVMAVLPELHVEPENARRLAKAICGYFTAGPDRIDNVQNEAAILLEGLVREVAHHLGVGTMDLPRLSETDVRRGEFATLGSLLTKIRSTNCVDEAWLDSIEYLATRPGVGLNVRNNAAHALGGRGERLIAGLTLYANLYLASLLGFRSS